ncbi:MAG: hypothetical protein LRY73_10055 [Bacillus sp. (in: Bacteria)]|nr:hypothetical protein [Bacillus sp. (in: firmicutes)]
MYEDSSGSKGKGETPQCEARGGSPAARGKRSIFPKRVIFVSIYSFGFLTTKKRLSQPLLQALS